MQDLKDFSLNIRNNIKTLRVKNGLSQEELAEKIDCSREHLTRIENGKINIGLGYFIKIALVFGVSLDELANFDNK